MSFPIDVVLVNGIQYLVDQERMFPLGARGVTDIPGDCRAWRYTKLGTSTTAFSNTTPGQGVFSNALSVAATAESGTAGECVLTATVSGMTANEYQGGLLSMYESGQPIVMMGVKSNTTTTITLDGKLPGNYTSSATTYVTPGPYHEVVTVGLSRSAGGLYEPCVGVFNSPEDKDGTMAATGDYCWIQTWGPCEMWACGTYEGDLGGEREVHIMGDGAAQISLSVSDTTQLGHQRIGFLYTCTGSASEAVGEHPGPTGGVVSAFMKHLIFLQIAP